MKFIGGHISTLALCAAIFLVGACRDVNEIDTGQSVRESESDSVETVTTGQQGPIVEVPNWEAVTPEEAIAGCDRLASHPLDPLKPKDVPGVASDDQVAIDAAYIYCNRAFISNQDNPRLAFQWGRVLNARTPQLPDQPRFLYKLAYRNGSEIAGVYLAKLPPERTPEEVQRSVQAKLAEWRREQQRTDLVPILGTPLADQLLIGSVVIITSIALLRILKGDATWDDGGCAGGYALNTATLELSCGGLIVDRL